MMNILKNSALFFLLSMSFVMTAQGLLDKIGEDKKIIKTGPYIGVQSGRFYAFELGMERQWKEGKLKSPNTNAFHFGINYSYDFRDWNPIMGYDIGWWHRQDNISLTYGIAACARTNFEQYRFGLVPTIGYKVWQIHLQTGAHLLYPFSRSADNYFTTNTLFLSARFVIINEKEVKRKSKDKKKS